VLALLVEVTWVREVAATMEAARDPAMLAAETSTWEASMVWDRTTVTTQNFKFWNVMRLL
jgi:hypothetical protein